MDFRFGIGLLAGRSRQKWHDSLRRAEDYGYDIVQVPDHIGAPAPFPALAAAAEITSLRLGTYVMNACFYKPALLARDVAALEMLSDGRFELGLGAGYVKEEFEAAELPFPSAGERIEYLAHVTSHVKEQVPTVPVMIAGSGDKLLATAARHADIIGLTGGKPGSTAADPMAERVEYVRAKAGDRFEKLELNLVLTAVSDADGGVDLKLARNYAATDEEALALPHVLTGTASDMADTLRRYRDDYGITYFSVQQPNIEHFARVIAELR